MNGGDPPTEHCPECDTDMVVWFDSATGAGETGPNPIGVCFSCGCEFNDRCPRCAIPVNNPFPDTVDDEGVPCNNSMFCGDCLDDL